MMRHTLLLILLILLSNVDLGYSSFTNPAAKSMDRLSAKTNSLSTISFNPEFSGYSLKVFSDSSRKTYPRQIGAFRKKANAEALYNKVISDKRYDANIILEDGLYKVRISLHSDKKENISSNTGDISGKPAVDSSALKNNYATPMSASQDSSPKFLSPAANPPEKNTVRKARIFFIRNDSPWLRRINYFNKSAAFVDALILAIVLSIGIMMMLLIFILLNRRRMEKEEELHQYLLEKYQGLILDYLFGNASPDAFRAIASDNYRRQVLIDQMIDISINLKGGEGKKLTVLYKLLDLDRDSINRAYDKRWHKKIKGFRELAFMNIKEANSAIYEAINSPNEILRMEAQIALVRLADGNPFEFLSHLTTPFSLWEQITLHELIIQHNITPPSFQQWLTSRNPTVIMFALRMIREFKQIESEEQVKETLLHRDPKVRLLAIQVAGDLDMRSTLNTMKHMYKNQDNNICLEIIKSMGKMPDTSMMGFLKLVLDKEDDVQLQIEAAKAIKNNGDEGVKALDHLMNSEYKNYKIIIRHVLDRRIY